jgi:two-component system, NtrC family, sensor kinase
MIAAEEMLAQLERELRAKDKTISALMDRVEARTDAGSAFGLLEQHVALERVVAAKTREISDQHARLQDALNELQVAHASLLQSHKLQAIGQLAAGIAHEINTPTQYVGDNLAFLRRAFTALVEIVQSVPALADAARSAGVEEAGALEARMKKLKLPFILKEVPKAIEQSLDGIARVSSIVSAMKEFSHPSGGELSNVDLNEAIKTTVTVARNEWKYVAELVLELAPDLPHVPCMRDEINQVVLNLVVNAAHAIADVNEGGAKGRGKITVGTRVDGTQVVIDVCDTGAGIPEKIRGRIFDPFFTTKPVGRGTGQGLAIARSVVVDKHKGTLSFDTELARGTTFHIRLPLAVPRAGGGEP